MAELQVNKVRHEENIALGDKPVTVGRASENDIVLYSKTVSRHHCVIEVVDGAPRLRDLGSRHGTKVNGRPVSECPLKPGDTIGVGSYEIVLDGPDVPAPDHGNGAASAAQHEAIEAEREALDRAAADLAQQREEIEAQASAIASRRDAFEHQEHALDELRQALEHERAALTTSREELEAVHARHAGEIEAIQARHAEEIAAIEAQLGEAAQRGEEKAERVRELEEELLVARDAERSIGTILQGIDLLHAAARRFESTQESRREIEAMWIEIDEQVRETLERHGQAHPEQLREREQVSEHLEAVHEEGDAAVAALVEIAERLHELSGRRTEPPAR